LVSYVWTNFCLVWCDLTFLDLFGVCLDVSVLFNSLVLSQI